MGKSTGNMRPHGGTSNVGNTRYGAPLTYAKPADHVEVVPAPPDPTLSADELRAQLERLTGEQDEPQG